MAYIDAGVINTPAHISDHKATFVVLPFQYDPHGCPIFVNERITLFNETHNFHPLNLNTLTHGSDILSTEDNICIFTAVHKFIKNTQRFSQNR